MKRTKVARIVFSEEEHSTLLKMAHEHGMQLATYIRMVAVREARRELEREGR